MQVYESVKEVDRFVWVALSKGQSEALNQGAQQKARRSVATLQDQNFLAGVTSDGI